MKKSFFKLKQDIYIVNTYVVPESSTAYKYLNGRDHMNNVSNIINELKTSGYILLCGDFNSRIANEPGLIREPDQITNYIPLPDDYKPDNYSNRCSTDIQKNGHAKPFFFL